MSLALPDSFKSLGSPPSSSSSQVDDVINVSGHRIGTAEVEGVLSEHDEVAEAAVVGWVPTSTRCWFVLLS